VLTWPDPPVAITLLGEFAVTVEGRAVDPSHWRRRPAASLVKLLALAPDRRLHREQVIDALWPDVAVADARRRRGVAAVPDRGRPLPR
jgi:DNA-binding SARP family transcriptional activator